MCMHRERIGVYIRRPKAFFAMHRGSLEQRKIAPAELTNFLPIQKTV
jgi:hypothetical protein